MYDGLEIDMLSLGDADCIVATRWTPQGPGRILIDGGKDSDFPVIKNFLLGRGVKDFWAVVCTHLHGDHVGGLIKLVQDRSFTFQRAWMHDIRNHLTPETLRRAASGTSDQASGVKEVWENTKALASAFAVRGLTPSEPFVGAVKQIAWDMVNRDATEIKIPAELMKARSPLTIVLAGSGLEPVSKLLKKMFRTDGPVFDYTNYRWAWQTACHNVGLGVQTKGRCYSGLRIHDLRCSAAINLVDAGVPADTVMKIGGWKTKAMFSGDEYGPNPRSDGQRC